MVEDWCRIVITDLPAGYAGETTILLVEDDISMRDLTALILRSAGYRVLEADGPAHAIQLTGTWRDPIHLLITDVIMPSMNGVKLSQQLTNIRPGLKVVFVSGYGARELAQQVSLASEAALLEKPFSRNALLTTIHTALRE